MEEAWEVLVYAVVAGLVVFSFVMLVVGVYSALRSGDPFHEETKKAQNE